MSAGGSAPESEWIGWQRNVWALALIVFTAFVGFNFVQPFLPLYVQELGVEDPGAVAIWSGVILGITPGIAAFLSPFWGSLADRYGRKAMLMRSLSGFCIIIAVMGLIQSVPQLLIARIVMGFFAGFSSMAMALASVSCPREKVPVAIGLVQSAQLVSVAIGPAAGGYVASHFGIRYAFFVNAFLCALALGGLFFLFREGRALGDARRKVRRMPIRDIFRFPNFPVLLALLFTAQFIDRGLGLLVPLSVARFPDVDPSRVAVTSGIVISVAAIGAAVSANLVPRLAVRFPLGRLLLAAFIGGGLLCLLAAGVQNWVALLVLRTAIALSLGCAVTLAYSLGGLTIPSEHRGAAFGWLAMGVQIGTTLSPLTTGGIAAASLPGAFFVDGGLAFLAAGLLIFGGRRLLTKGPADPLVAQDPG
ncbi:MAG TPA: MFS transporter [Dehalococcoidia bacterium]|nr:MFS transporter [Dehalococcoidia bacterium]